MYFKDPLEAYSFFLQTYESTSTGGGLMHRNSFSFLVTQE